MKLLEFLDVTEASSEPGTFVGARLTRDSEKKLADWMRDNGLRKKEPRSRLHITVLGSPDRPIDWNPATFEPPLEIPLDSYRLDRFGDDGKAVVLTFSVPELEKRHREGCEKHGIDWPHPTYQPHLTLSMDPNQLNDISRLLMPTFPMYVQNEYVQPWEFNESEESDRRRQPRIDIEVDHDAVEGEITFRAKEPDGTIVGIGEYDIEKEEFNMMWTRKSRRRRGIATQIYDKAEEIGLRVEPSERLSPASIGLWTKRGGFRPGDLDRFDIGDMGDTHYDRLLGERD